MNQNNIFFQQSGWGETMQGGGGGVPLWYVRLKGCNNYSSCFLIYPRVTLLMAISVK